MNKDSYMKNDWSKLFSEMLSSSALGIPKDLLETPTSQAIKDKYKKFKDKLPSVSVDDFSKNIGISTEDQSPKTRELIDQLREETDSE